MMLPEKAGHVVSMIEFRDHIIIACQFAVYRYVPAFAVGEEDRWELLLEVPTPTSESPNDHTG